MPVTFTVSTADAAPGVAPYRISNKPGHDKADLTFSLGVDEGLVPRDGVVPRDGLMPGQPHYHSLRVLPGDRDLARDGGFKPLVTRGLVCGIGDRCGPGRRSLDIPSTFIMEDGTYTEVGETTDGLYPFFVHYMTNAGWF